MDTALAQILARLDAAEAAIGEVQHTIEIITGGRPLDDEPRLQDERRSGQQPRRTRAGPTRGPPLDDAHDRYLPTAEVAHRYLTSTRSVDRWAGDPQLDFPKPFYINGRKFWSLNALRAWDRQRVRLGAQLKREKVGKKSIKKPARGKYGATEPHDSS
jgi:hypothetical protein